MESELKSVTSTSSNFSNLSLSDQIKINIARRKQELETEAETHTVVANKIVTEELVNVKGVQRHLANMRIAKINNGNKEIRDAHSHGYIRKCDINN
jgi:hypothetical protein